MPPQSLIYRENRATRRVRRIVDVVVSASASTVSAPFLVIAAIASKRDDGGPILFAQRRVGRFERLFTIYKLRTMRVRAITDELSPTSADDDRITRVGFWLRKTSVDELPQLLNVLRGEMTLIGPRPEMPFLVRGFEPWQHLRHLAIPGITGLWQVRARSTVPLHLPEATHMDLEYITTASLKTDGAIIVNTLRSVFSTQGAY